MERQEFLLQQFLTLRDEIKSTKQRLFLIVFIGLIAVPLIAYLAQSQATSFGYVAPMLPFLVLVLTVLFFAEQNALMRCGHFIRANIEPQIMNAPGWETWLESKPDLRLMDKYFAGCFMVVFFVFYFLSTAVAIIKLAPESLQGDKPYEWRLIAAGAAYSIGAIWMVITLLHHWRSCTTTQE